MHSSFGEDACDLAIEYLLKLLGLGDLLRRG